MENRAKFGDSESRKRKTVVPEGQSLKRLQQLNRKYQRGGTNATTMHGNRELKLTFVCAVIELVFRNDAQPINWIGFRRSARSQGMKGEV
ncbi:hypothetical protein N7471_000179 [Penicillium samsonianum]|uniref:uncharacterized protein n=1 Tax=Penicillium samsonianum TaxID=1882272 RepID=UPI00254713D7|nr:uncharacterized protein N7471_000179 [Penicillium samsonianum]KAJ6148980.1 hypothetical protein N7471_000179 [Penicillium samsonianum]